MTAAAMAIFGCGRAGAVEKGDLPSLEYQVKAAFLLKFAMFVEWPAKAFKGPADPLQIGLLGEDRFGSFLDEAARRESASGRPFQINRLKDVSEAATMHMIFVADADAEQAQELAQSLARKPVLLVGDNPPFASQGGAINFYKDGGRVRFEVNQAAATRAGLKFNARFLQIARVVEDSSTKGGS